MQSAPPQHPALIDSFLGTARKSCKEEVTPGCFSAVWTVEVRSTTLLLLARSCAEDFSLTDLLSMGHSWKGVK